MIIVKMGVRRDIMINYLGVKDDGVLVLVKRVIYITVIKNIG